MKVKVINLDGVKRVIHGSLINDIDIDYTQDIHSMVRDVEFALQEIIEIHKTKPLSFFKKKPKNIRVYEGGHHFDIIEDGVGSVGWLTVSDHVA
ncbi:hypothetical protein [Acinetobacter sp. P1(2025)]|uniref:hypothetical protein n=1 Tax=Acinetobacter sp. P1(2025) TaxID=3446120 RepID=UPI003F534E94